MTKKQKMPKPYLGKQKQKQQENLPIDINSVPDEIKELIHCECGNQFFDQKLQFYKIKQDGQNMYVPIVVNVCDNDKCHKVLPEKP